ncbi:MAG TPA: hypothetical protein VI583_00210 [Cyclobacteriaceae bacterium]|nr:hypothetical protein [Cyclobacteriaceae bacterium]
MKIKPTSLMIMLAIFSQACRDLQQIDPGTSFFKVKGFVQKGPFITGANLSISELSSLISPTGKVYITQITDPKGSFESDNIEMISKYASLWAEGYYYNEVTGEQSASPISLYAISDLTDKNTVNVNILSSLEKGRVEYLISSGMLFADAKRQAQDEVLAVFSIDEDIPKSSEEMDISHDGQENAILLAVSLIMQGYRTEAELTELLAQISFDIREDGILNSTSLGSELINHAQYVKLNMGQIRSNLLQRYADLEVSSVIPDFEHYMDNFIDNTTFPVTKTVIGYPEQGAFGQNILTLDDTEFNGRDFSLAAKMPAGTSLKIKLTLLEGDTLGAIWMYYPSSSINWAVTIFDWTTKSQEFTSIESGMNNDLNMVFEESYRGKYLMEYFEMGSPDPTRTKIIFMN